MNYKNFLKKAVVMSILFFFISTNISTTGEKIEDRALTQINDSYMIDDTTIQVNINSLEFEFGTSSTDNGEFSTIKLPKGIFTTSVGKAKLPLISYTFEIPQGANPIISIQKSEWESSNLQDLNLPSMILPVQPSQEKGSIQKPDFVLDEQYYSSNTFLPEYIAEIKDISEMRGHRFVLVEITPVKYNPSSSEIQTMISCEFTIDLLGSDIDLTYEKLSRYSAPSFEDSFKNMFDNYGYYERNILQREEEGFLIIVYDDFIEEIEPLEELKINFGFDTTVTKTSDIPGGATKENIKEYIEEAYNEWTNPPAYVLLVGDTDQIPTFPGQTSGPTAVDLYYVTINSEDYFPDIHIGRFPASQESHVTAMVDKTVYYETGNFGDNGWIKKAAFMAGNDNYQISEGTHNYVIDTYLEPNGYNCTKLYEVTYGATTQDVKDALNDGRSLAIFSGHGSTTSWADGPTFTQSDVNSLTNTDMYPFVCSHACVTGSFALSECFGETWLRAEDKAGLAFWGSSANTLWTEDDILERGMFQAWWDDGLETIGGMTDMGLYYLYENYSGGGYTKYYFECYNILGDPSVKIWTDDPNSPPEKPEIPNGPDEGATTIEYTFSSSTTDPEGEEIYYIFDWGDGTDSGWIGPYNSGQTGEATHAWEDEDIYEVKVIAMDENGRQSQWSDPTTINILQSPLMDIGIVRGGFFKINAEIKNIGSLEATNIDWKIELNGGAFMGKNSTGTIPSIQPGDEETVSSNTIIGFGETQVTVSATIPQSSDSRTQGGNIFFFYLIVHPSGD